ncbi:MAG: hypothetical protein WEC35_07215 [Nitrosopumilaceae archaeon]
MAKKWIIPVIILAFAIPLLIYSTSNLIVNQGKIDVYKQQSLPLFEESFGLSLQNCDPDKKMSEKELQWCKDDMKFQLDECDFYGNPDFCNDPRIDKIMNKKSTSYTETSDLPEVKNPTQVDMKTYTNSEHNFSIDYPAHWNTREVLYFPEDIVTFQDEDKTKFGMPNFIVKKDNNEFATHVESARAYKTSLDQFGVGLGKVTIDSENKMIINDVDTYELKYKIKMQISETVKPNYCDGTVFVFDTPQNNLIFEYGTCDNPSYYDFVPIFERMAQSFKIIS